MEVFNMDQGDDLTATGGGIAEGGATIALRTAMLRICSRDSRGEVELFRRSLCEAEVIERH